MYRRVPPLHRAPAAQPEKHVKFYETRLRDARGLMENRIKTWGSTGSDTTDPTHEQVKCLFYKGIPQEVTDMIFQYALSPEITEVPFPFEPIFGLTGHDFDVHPYHDEPRDNESDDASDSENRESSLAPGIPQSHELLPQSHQRQRHVVGYDWFRPEVVHKTIYPGKNLLLTCRRVYLDAQMILARNQEIVLWQEPGAPPLGGQTFRYFANSLRQDVGQPHLEQIRSLRVYSRISHLQCLAEEIMHNREVSRMKDETPEGTQCYWQLRSLLSSGQGPVEPIWRMFHNLEEFHLVLRRSDWHDWREGRSLAIEIYHPKFAVPHAGLMQEQIRAALDGHGKPAQPAFEDGSLGSIFRIMTNLKKLTISFETAESKRHEMEEIVAWAQTWCFEIMSWRHWMIPGNNEVIARLVCDDEPPQKMSWRGLHYHWADRCTGCSVRITQPAHDCATCQERILRLRSLQGPKMLVWTLTWRPELVDPPISLADIDEE